MQCHAVVSERASLNLGAVADGRRATGLCPRGNGQRDRPGDRIALTKLPDGQVSQCRETGGECVDGIIGFDGKWSSGETFVSLDRKAVGRLIAKGFAAVILD